MNRKQTTLFTHLASWIALMVVPLMTMGHGEGITPRHILLSMGVMLSFMSVFYINFLWITPRYYANGERRYYFLFNTIVIIAVAVAFHFWIEMCNDVYPSTRRFHHEGFHLGFLLRTMFNLGIVTLISTALNLAALWRKTEDARLEAEAARADAELRTLRNQINPHFLLNTLNNIYALTAFDTAKAQTAIQQLSKMLRHLLYDNEQSTVPLKDEIDFLENYINLMRIRLPKTVDVTLSVQCATYNISVAPVIFISLVENAFKHGISPTEPSFIHIVLTADEHHITCNIANSNHPKDAADQSGHGIGLQQVQQRLELAYPGQYTWVHGERDNGKTYQSIITIRL